MTQTKDLLAGYKRPEKSRVVCLAGDLQAEFEDLERDLKVARDQKEPGTLGKGENALATDLAQRIMALREEMRAHSHVFRFRGLRRKAYSDLVKECPPSEEDKEKGNAVDWDLFPVRLVAASAIEPTMTDEDAVLWADELTQAQWDSLVQAAIEVNNRDVDVPFSYTASAVLQSSRKS
jgi:hypothetical protein